MKQAPQNAHATSAGNGWIKLYRSLMQHWVFEDPFMLRVWIEVLLSANHKGRKFWFGGDLQRVERGSFVVSKLKWSKRLGVSRPKLDRALKLMEADQMLVQRTCSRNTLISVTNYHQLQLREEFSIATAVAANEATAEQQRDSVNAPEEQQRCTNKKDNNSKNEKTDQEVGGDAATAHELDRFLEPLESDSVWSSEPQFVMARRRPLKKYPELFLTPEELAQVFEQLADAGIPSDRFKMVFMRAAARLTTYRIQGKVPAAVSAFNWLTGWAKNEVVEELTASCKLERNRAYLEGAKI